MVWEAAYDAFGEAAVNPASTVTNNFRFPGQYYDAETGLHYNRHRYYDPKMGRYLTPDPIGLAGGINPYVYVDGDPVNGMDPLGLYRSPEYLRATVPGQVLYDHALTALENGDYATAAVYFAGMLAEQLVVAGTLGQSSILKGATVCEVGIGESGPAARSLGAAAVQNPRVLQTGGHTLNRSTIETLGLTKEQAKNAMEAFKSYYRIPASFHDTKILSNGDIVNRQTGQYIGNIYDFLT